MLSVYDGRKNYRFYDELSSLTMGSVIAGVSLAGTMYLSYREVSRMLFLAFILLSYTSLILWRSGARIFFRLSAKNGGLKRKVLIIGAGPVGRELQQRIEQNPMLSLRVCGFLDDDAHKRRKFPDIFGNISDLYQVTLEQQIDDVVIALPVRAYDKVNQIMEVLNKLPLKVWVIPDYFELAIHKSAIENFAGLPMLDLRAPALNDYQRMTKRIFDLFAVLCVSIPSSILMAIIAIAIRLEGPGPVFFVQKRVGENGYLFDMYKFRTMVPNAEDLRHLVEQTDENGNLIHKHRDDPRVTRVGKILRKTSLDELPQIINIFKGEMSLVGPRPELPYLVKNYQTWQMERFAVPQGLTGWWQINGRSDRPMHLNTEDDLYYVKHYSIFLDILIIFKTIWVVLRGQGAF
jgi:exopolysaccharide biosynthesis polyprenyl glycosylphosphotransferase